MHHMMQSSRTLLLVCLLVVTAASCHGMGYTSGYTGLRNAACSMLEPGIPLGQTHSHNTYDHPGGIMDALAAGFCSFEADFFYNGSALWIAHDQANIRPDWTLESMYLDPFVAIIQGNGGTMYPASKVFGGCKSIVLLCDAKEYNDDTSEAAARRQYDALQRVLAKYQSKYPGLFTVFYENGTIVQGIINVYESGLRPSPAYVAAMKERPLALDGRLENLNNTYGPSVYPLVSQGFTDVCPDPAPPDNATLPTVTAYDITCMKTHAKLIKSYIATAHRQHRTLRIWDTVDTPEMWSLLIEYGVDYVNVDALQDFRDYAFQEWGQRSALKGLQKY